MVGLACGGGAGGDGQIDANEGRRAAELPTELVLDRSSPDARRGELLLAGVAAHQHRRCTPARDPYPPTTQPPHDARAFATDRARAAPPQDRSRARTGRAGPAVRPPSVESSTADAAHDRRSDATGLQTPTRTRYRGYERMVKREPPNVGVDRVFVCSSMRHTACSLPQPL